MTSICLVSCVSKKSGEPSRAEFLYKSPWFRLARDYALGFDRWAILSAKYGLVLPNMTIPPYEVTLNDMCKADRDSWGENCIRQWRSYSRFFGVNGVSRNDPLYLPPPEEMAVTVLAGKKYRDSLPIDFRAPMAGLGIGEQMQWLKRQLSYSVVV